MRQKKCGEARGEGEKKESHSERGTKKEKVRRKRGKRGKGR